MFTQKFLLKKAGDTVNNGVVATRVSKADYVGYRTISGILTRPSSSRSVVSNKSESSYGTSLELNIRLNPDEISIDEVSEGDLLQDIRSGIQYRIEATHEVLTPPYLEDVLHIKCRVTAFNNGKTSL